MTRSIRARLLASVLAGWLWDVFGASLTFIAGGVFSVVALAAVLGTVLATRPRAG